MVQHRSHATQKNLFCVECMAAEPQRLSSRMSSIGFKVSTISFAEIIHGRDSSVRVTDDGLIYAVDLVMVVTELERKHAGQALRRVMERNLLGFNLKHRNTGGQGNSKTELINLKDAIQLIMVLPGEMAKTIRAQIGDVMTKFFAGDESLVDQIRANSESNSAIAQLARASLPDKDREDPDSRHKRIKREELELARLEQEIQEKRIHNMSSFMTLMTQIRPDWMQTDARFRLQTEDMVKNIITTAPGSAQLALTNSSEQGKSASLSISQLAQELGCKALSHGDACSVGRMAAKRYKASHGAEPPKHRQWVDGAERVVNSYTEADRALLVTVLTDLGLVPE